MIVEKYWEDKEIRSEVKEIWGRMGHGSVGRERKRGYKNAKCKICGRDNKTLEPICKCVEAKVEIRELVDVMEKWRGRRVRISRTDHPKISESYFLFKLYYLDSILH